MSFIADLLRRAERRRTLMDLLGYDERMLRDIGLTRDEITRMRTKPYASPGRGHE